SRAPPARNDAGAPLHGSLGVSTGGGGAAAGRAEPAHGRADRDVPPYRSVFAGERYRDGRARPRGEARGDRRAAPRGHAERGGPTHAREPAAAPRHGGVRLQPPCRRGPEPSSPPLPPGP